MSEIFFVRHGQASLGSKNYDQLSELGKQQALWLGEHYRQRNLQFDRVITGDMHRHKQTLAGIEEGLGQRFESSIDPGFNEFHFRPIMAMYARRENPEAEVPRNARQFFGILRGTMRAWIKGQLDADIAQYDAQQGSQTETWLDFNQRVSRAGAHRLLRWSQGSGNEKRDGAIRRCRYRINDANPQHLNDPF